MPKSFLIDTTRCTACRGCQVACKEWHDHPANVTKQRGTHQNPPDLNPYNFKIVRFREHLNAEGKVVWNFFPEQCRHCLSPVCVDVVDVLFTEKAAGVSPEAAQAVIDACPYNIPRYDGAAKRLTKCDMCVDRVSNGMVPMCVKTCPTGAMFFGERAEVLETARTRLESVKAAFPKARLIDAGDVNVIYLLAEEPEHYHEFAAFAQR